MMYRAHLHLQAELSDPITQVLISSSQAGQVAGSLEDPAGYEGVFGAGTSLMIEYLREHPSASPTDIIRYLNTVCSKRPQGALRLLPGPTTVL
ncbi:hypothetical protein FRC01_011763 [Tulasnella sp. 417]|nr:hypothetical protein FRC01_011763 [Tulasnella sp. 417]